ncbi:MAG TPA: ABC transporter ATP-binding protein [Candidatus Dormibacteraeota bacterium]|jgi:ABC-type branched-subunit amino acid transport system ATPase component|nr:ABC transporter ATP-binding protein [Candidatus Dormibacteraeota bacterium]
MAQLEVQGVTVRFRGLVALDDVSLSVSHGEVVGLIGPNGAGKTTLFNSITGMQAVSAGSVTFEERNITRYSADRRSRMGIARTFQTVQLLTRMSAFDNILLGCQARMHSGLFSDGFRLPRSYRDEVRARREVEDVVDFLGIAEYAYRGVGQLPLGIRRLVEIARAICSRPKLLLLDEAASGIGRDETGALQVLFRRIRDEFDLSMLVVEHDVDFVLGLCDYVYVLDFGRLIARGMPEDVRSNPKVITAYLGEPEAVQALYDEPIEEPEGAPMAEDAHVAAVG